MLFFDCSLKKGRISLTCLTHVPKRRL